MSRYCANYLLIYVVRRTYLRYQNSGHDPGADDVGIVAAERFEPKHFIFVANLEREIEGKGAEM